MKVTSMHPFRSVRIAALAVACVVLAASARAQIARTPPPKAESQPLPQGFSVVLVLSDAQSSAIADNVPQAARKALADMKDFLPYRGYRLLDAAWILGSQRSTSRLRGPDDQEYLLTVVTEAQPGGVHVRFQLQEPGAAVMTMREGDEAAARRAQEADLQTRLERLQKEAVAMRQRLGEKHVAVVNAEAEVMAIKQRLAAYESGQIRPRTMLDGRSIIDTSFSMEIGETVVVGTSRMRGGDKALIALLTAVPKGASAKRE